jgi:hypothetical protein
MTETCTFCGQQHSFRKCPMFGKKEEYLAAYAPKPYPTGEAKPSPSLPPTQFEQLFGRGAEAVLQDVLDHPDSFTHDEVNLCWQILSGAKVIKKLDAEDRTLLDHIAIQLATMNKPVSTRPPERQLPERRLEDDEGPPRDGYDELVTTGQVDPSDG